MSSQTSKSSGDILHRHHSNGSCSDGCNGAIPRNPQYYSHHHKRNGHYPSKGRVNDLQNRLPPIKEFRSPTKVAMPSPTHNPKIRYRIYYQFV